MNFCIMQCPWILLYRLPSKPKSLEINYLLIFLVPRAEDKSFLSLGRPTFSGNIVVESKDGEGNGRSHGWV